MPIQITDEKIDNCLRRLDISTKDKVTSFLRYLRRKNYSPVTVKRRMYHLRDFFRFINACPAAITPGDIDRFIEHKQDKGNGALSINGHLGSIRQFYMHLEMDAPTLRNPVIIKRHYLSVPKTIPRNMSESDLEKFFGTDLSVRDRAIFLLMLRCGLRTGEVIRLAMLHIDFESHSLKIINTKYQYDRMVYLSEDAESALKDWLIARKDHANPYVFTTDGSKDKQIPMNASVIQKAFHQYREQAGISSEKGYTPHCLRHTFATQLINARIPITSLKELMGHRYINDTMRYVEVYSHTIREQYFRAMAQIESTSKQGD